jgi:hypothetical protein
MSYPRRYGIATHPLFAKLPEGARGDRIITGLKLYANLDVLSFPRSALGTITIPVGLHFYYGIV